MSQWFTYVHWYYKKALSPDVTVDDFFTAPVVNTSWKVYKQDPELVACTECMTWRSVVRGKFSLWTREETDRGIAILCGHVVNPMCNLRYQISSASVVE